MLWLLLRLPAFLQAHCHGHLGRGARLPWGGNLGRGAKSPENLLGFLREQSGSDAFGSAARRNECLANALCWVSLGNSAALR